MGGSWKVHLVAGAREHGRGLGRLMDGSWLRFTEGSSAPLAPRWRPWPRTRPRSLVPLGGASLVPLLNLCRPVPLWAPCAPTDWPPSCPQWQPPSCPASLVPLLTGGHPALERYTGGIPPLVTLDNPAYTLEELGTTRGGGRARTLIW